MVDLTGLFYVLFWMVLKFDGKKISKQFSEYTSSFHKKVRIWASTESLLKLSDFEYSEFLTSFLKVP